MRKQHDIGAKDFINPLLLSLYELSNGEPNKIVPFKATHAPTCARLGVDILQYGYGQNRRPQTIVWIGWAFTKYIRDTGLGKLTGRGKWALTEEGIAQARALLAKDADETHETPVILAKVEDDTEPEPIVQTTGVSLEIGPVDKTETSTYHEDPYIRSLAIARTKCFGYFATRSPACQSCTLTGACRNKIAAEMSTLAQILAKEDQAAAIAKATSEAEPPTETVPEPTPQPGPAPTDTGTWDNSEAEIIVVHVAAKCYRCGDPIEGGSEVYWIKDKGDRKGGLFHKECK